MQGPPIAPFSELLRKQAGIVHSPLSGNGGVGIHLWIELLNPVEKGLCQLNDTDFLCTDQRPGLRNRQFVQIHASSREPIDET